MQDGPPSSSDDAKASVTGLRSDAVRRPALGGVDERGRREADQHGPVAVGGDRGQQRGHRGGPVLAGDAGADDEVVLRAGLQPRGQHLRPVGGQRVDPVDLLVDVEVEAQVVEQDDADHGGERHERPGPAGDGRGSSGGAPAVRRVPTALPVRRAAGGAASPGQRRDRAAAAGRPAVGLPGAGAAAGVPTGTGRQPGLRSGLRSPRRGRAGVRPARTAPPGTGGRPARTAGGGSSATGRRLLDAAGGAAAADGAALAGEQLLDGHRLGGGPVVTARASGDARETPRPPAPSRVGCSPTGVDTFSSSALPRPCFLPTIRGDRAVTTPDARQSGPRPTGRPPGATG